MRVNRHKQKPKPTVHVYSSLSNEEEEEEEWWQLLAAMKSTPGVYVV